MAKTAGELIASALPARDDECESDYIALVDIVVTGIETPWRHFWVSSYDPDAKGVDDHWAYLYKYEDLQLLGEPTFEGTPVILNEETVRAAVAAYINTRIDAGMSYAEAAKMVDGSYTDAVIADSILQFALYGEVVFS